MNMKTTIPILLLGFIEIVVSIYMVSLLAVFFSKVYLIVTENKI